MDNYIELAMRTCAPGDNLLHCALGLVTEVAEVAQTQSVEHAAEEMGDVMWYVAVGCDHFGLTTLEQALAAAPEGEARDGIWIVGDFVNQLKREIFYKKPIDPVLMVKLLGELIQGLQEECEFLGLDFEQILVDNITKLQKRYPEGFAEVNH